MSLAPLFVMVVVGIGAIVAAIHFTGGTVRAGLSSGQAAVARFRDDFPEEATGVVHLTASGDAAFIELGSGRTGFVQAFGDRYLTRIVAPAGIVSCRRSGETIVSVLLADFTATGGTYAFATADEAEAVASMLAPALAVTPEEAV